MFNNFKNWVRFDYRVFFSFLLSFYIFLISDSSTLVFAQEDDFPWALFLPAITSIRSNNGNNGINCGNIAGCYTGNFSENCTGITNDGVLNLTINGDCSFSTFSNYGIQAIGKITAINGTQFYGGGETGNQGCGKFSFSGIRQADRISGQYSFANGGTGSLPNAILGPCKPLNQLKTEMLGGDWEFVYQIISIWIDYYYLDINDVWESTVEPGQYYISGINQFYNLVIASYSPSLNEYTLFDSGSNIDLYFVFHFDSIGQVSGCYYQIDKSDGSWSPCFNMFGNLIGSPNLLSMGQELKLSSTLSKLENEDKKIQELNIIQSASSTIESVFTESVNLNLLNSYDKLKEIYKTRMDK